MKSSGYSNHTSQYGFSLCPTEVLFMTAQIGPSISQSRKNRWYNLRETLELAPSNPRLQPNPMGRKPQIHGICRQSHPGGLSNRCKPPQRSLKQVQTTPEVSQTSANYPRGPLDKLSFRITGRSRSAAPAASTHRMKSGMTVDRNHTDISSTKPMPTSLDTTKLNMK